MIVKNGTYRALIVSNVVAWVALSAISLPYLASNVFGPDFTDPFTAATYGKHGELDLWLRAGGNPNAIIPIGTLLQAATSQHGNFETVSLLLRFGADPNLVAEIEDSSPLTRAARNSDFGTFVLLLENGANPTHKAFNGDSVQSALALKDCPHGIEKAEYLQNFLARSSELGPVRESKPANMDAHGSE